MIGLYWHWITQWVEHIFPKIHNKTKAKLLEFEIDSFLIHIFCWSKAYRFDEHLFNKRADDTLAVLRRQRTQNRKSTSSLAVKSHFIVGTAFDSSIQRKPYTRLLAKKKGKSSTIGGIEYGQWCCEWMCRIFKRTMTVCECDWSYSVAAAVWTLSERFLWNLIETHARGAHTCRVLSLGALCWHLFQW